MNKNTAEEKELRGSKIPKSSTAKEKHSKTFMETKTTQSSSVTIHSVSTKQTEIVSIQNVKQLSIVQTTREVMNCFQAEGLKSDDHTTEYVTPVLVQDKENTFKRVQLKEKSSQSSQKPSGNVPTKPSTSDFKKCAAYGGLKFAAKRSNCRKPDLFQKAKELKKDSQDIHVTEPCTKGIKTIDSANRIASKHIEQLNKGNLVNPPTNKTKSKKSASVILKENAIKKPIEDQGLCFAPKWKSTPLKQELLENINEEFNHDNSSLEWLKKVPKGSKSIAKEKNDNKTVIQDKTAEAKECVSTPPLGNHETDYKICTAFAGMRLKPKKKSTLETSNIFENVLKESHSSGISIESMQMFSKATNSIIGKQQSQVEKLNQTSTQISGSSETITITTKKVVNKPVPTFAGLHLKQRQKKVPDIFEAQKAKVGVHS